MSSPTSPTPIAIYGDDQAVTAAIAARLTGMDYAVETPAAPAPGPGVHVLAFQDTAAREATETLLPGEQVVVAEGERIPLGTLRQLALRGQTPRVLAFAGSRRRGSLNQRLLQAAALHTTRLGAQSTVLDLQEFDLPIFCQDHEDEHGLPAPARRLGNLLMHHHGVLLASPEYNGGFSALMKNTLDWASRATAGAPGRAAFSGLFVSLLAASPGPMGATKVIVALRTVLSHMGAFVMPTDMVLTRAGQAFAEDGDLKDPGRLHALADELVGQIRRSYR